MSVEAISWALNMAPVPADRDRQARARARTRAARARRATRNIPIPPELVRLLREHIETFGTSRGGRLFRSENGNPIQPSTYWRVWQKARAMALCRECRARDYADLSRPDYEMELPENPSAGPCARCGAVGDLCSGCCAACFAAGFREECSHMACLHSGRPQARGARRAR